MSIHIPGSRDSNGTLEDPTARNADDTNESLYAALYDRSQIQDHPSSDLFSPSPREMKKPFYQLTPVLSRPIFLIFAGLFSLGIASLEVMNYISQRHNGIATVDQNERYLWTYGPTFILTMLLIVWTRAEYQTKQAMPWVEMRRGPAEPKRSFLLNYTTAADYEVLWDSLKIGHYSVTLVTSGTFLLRLLIVTSTGLLALDYREIDQAGTLTALDKFDFTQNIVDPDPMVGPTFWAIQQFNASYPMGTTPDFSTQSFLPVEKVENATTRADLEVFSVDIECEPFTWKYSASFDEDQIASQEGYKNRSTSEAIIPPICANVDLTTASCSVNEFCFKIASMQKSMATGWVQKVNCSNSTEKDPPRIVICKGAYGTTVDIGESLPSGASQVEPGPPHIDNFAGALCIPKYSLDRRTVTNSTRLTQSTEVLKASKKVKEKLSMGATTTDLTDGIIRTMNGESTQLDSFGADVTPWFNLLGILNPDINNKAFNDSGMVASLSQEIFPSFVHQWAHSGHMVSTNQTIEGILTVTRARLCVQKLSLRVMEVLLVVFILVGAFLSCSHYVSHHERPGSLLSHAWMLSRSPGLEKVLNGTGALPEKTLKETLESHQLRSSKAHDETLDDAICIDPETVQKAPKSGKTRFWRPMASAWWFRTITISVSLLLVIALEILCQYSAAHDGIANVSMEGYTKYTWVFIPSITLALVALSFSILDFTARMMHPYRELHEGCTNLGTMLFEPLGKPTAVALFQSLKRRKYALCSIVFTSMMGPVLTIAASGLFAPVPIPLSQAVPIQLDDWYNFSLPERDGATIDIAGKSVLIGNLIAFKNLSYPQWTYDGLAFPTAQVNRSALADLPNKTTTMPLAARLPAVRAQMNCSLNGFFRNRNLTFDLRNQYAHMIEPQLPCTPRTDDGTIQRPYIRVWDLGNYIRTDGFFAHSATYDTQLSPWTPNDYQRLGGGDFCGDGRKHAWYVVGNQAGAITTELALLHCMPYIEALHADVRLSYPTYRLRDAPPPAPVEGSARFLTRCEDQLDVLIDPSDHYDAPMALLVPNSSMPADASKTLDNPTIDPFFQAIVWGKDGTPIQELQGEHNVGRLIERMQALYARLKAQDFRFSYRSAEAALGSGGSGEDEEKRGRVVDLLANVTGTIVDDETRLRLVQSRVSTGMLEALLVAMVVCAVVSLVLEGKGRRILPRDPGSVAAKMSLFAGSDMVKRLREEIVGQERSGRDEIDGGTWWGKEKEAERRLEGHVFSLGWWEMEESDAVTPRRFGIDVGVARE